MNDGNKCDTNLEIDGIIIVNKPKNCTSNNVVNRVKKILNVKVGHTGTLDPNATGVLPLLLGKGTKFSKYLINHDKKYIATLELGKKTSTGDIEGDVIEKKDVDNSILDEEKIKKYLNSFIGKITQTPPIYSAIKIKGKRLYEYARKNIEVEIPKRTIEIYSMKLIDFSKENKTIVFEVECSKGTYIRSLCEDIAEKMGTVGYMKELERARVGEFDISNSVTIDEIEKNKDNKIWLEENIISLEDLLKNNEKILLKDTELEKFLNGVKIKCNKKDGLCNIYCNEKFIGSGIVQGNLIKRDIVIRGRIVNFNGKV